jgi:asparagine synthase (glutamine-hydrolysing)
MCGIFALLNNVNHLLQTLIDEQFQKGKHRGPEHSIISPALIQCQLGFHRLAINGLTPESNQPICIGNITLICNGEIYNYKEIYRLMGVDPTTSSDCEVIIHLYKRYGIDHTLQMLDGVFAFCLIDQQFGKEPSKMYIARDPYGVRPLYSLQCNSAKRNKNEMELVYGFASEMKMLVSLSQTLNDQMSQAKKTQKLKRTSQDSDKTNKYKIGQVGPGTYSMYELAMEMDANWKCSIAEKIYHTPGFQSCALTQSEITDTTFTDIQYYLRRAVFKRCSTTDRPIACLLSGGLDSSLITALVNEYHTTNGLPVVETYSIGLAGASDLAYAKQVATYLGTKHTEIILSEQEFLDAIDPVIYDIESYDTTTVRASIGNWLLGKYISEHSKAKVIFNGDGSDELAGGYLYMGHAPDSIEFDKECRRLLRDIHKFDVLRSDKSISSHGLEPRTPFLDRQWVQYYLSLPLNARFHGGNRTVEKYLIRKAFSEEKYTTPAGKPLLPDEILWRRKEAFSDGVSTNARSLYEIIGDYAADKFKTDDCALHNTDDNASYVFEDVALLNPNLPDLYDHLLPKTAEQYYYRKIFEKHYPGQGKIVPYFWMPKYVNATDASARTLAIYKEPSLAGSETKDTV